MDALTVYAVPQFPTAFRDGEAPASARPLICYRYSGPNGKYSTPTFSPDGGRLAWAEDDGVKIVTVPSFAGGCTLDGATPTAPLVIPGGKQPDWGPADGFAVKVTVPSAGRVKATATDRGLKVASASKRVKAGKATVRLRFTRGARNALNNARGVKLRVKVTFKSSSTALALKLKR